MPRYPRYRPSANHLTPSILFSKIVFDNTKPPLFLSISIYPRQLTKLFETILSTIPPSYRLSVFCSAGLSNLTRWPGISSSPLFVRIPSKEEGISSSFSMGRRRERGERGEGETPWEEEKKGRRRKIIIIPVDGDIVVDRWTDIKRFDRVC